MRATPRSRPLAVERLAWNCTVSGFERAVGLPRLNGSVLPDIHHDPVLCAALADDLAAAGYTATALRAAWGPLGDAGLGRGIRHTAVRALGDRDDALATLARVLGLGISQSAAAVDAALPRCGSAGLLALGLARADAGMLVPAALVRPQEWSDGEGDGEWWVASDLDEATLGGPLPEGHVLGVGGASLTLAGLQLPRRARRVLDVGTGCGIQALRAARTADEIVVTDTSARALAFATLTLRLNGIDAVGVRQGSLYEPVAGEAFDRIVSNPPFVITPRRAGVPVYEYRDGGAVGDALVARAITGAADVLAPGGIAQLLGNWEYRAEQDGLDRVRGWVAEASVPLDAWIIERERLDPLAYAELWVRDGGTAPGSPAYAALVDAWLDDFEQRGVTEVGFGYVLLRRPADGVPTLDRYERVATTGDAGGLGADLDRALTVHDLLARWDDDHLAAATFTVAADVTEARHFVPGNEDPSVLELRQGRGFARSLAVDPALAALVGACDGDLSVGALSDAIAHLLEVDAEALRRDILPRVRDLAVWGFLDPA